MSFINAIQQCQRQNGAILTMKRLPNTNIYVIIPFIGLIVTARRTAQIPISVKRYILINIAKRVQHTFADAVLIYLFKINVQNANQMKI